MIPAASIRSPDVQRLADEARRFLSGFRWCGKITELSLGYAIAGVLGVFRAEIAPVEEGVDSVLWVIVGDLPPAYLTVDPDADWQAVLEAYVREMDLWVHAVQRGESLDEVIPVNVPPTIENASLLASRLHFLRTRLLTGTLESLPSDV